MNKSNWKRVKKREYIYTELEEKEIKGECSLLHIFEVTSPSFKQYGELSVKIADKGYYWLQIVLKRKNYWITAMYNEKKQIVQYYIDITKKNVIKNDGFILLYYYVIIIENF